MEARTIQAEVLRTALVAAAYSLLALVLSFPLIRHFNSYIMGWPDDGSMSLWGFWWVNESLLDSGKSLLSTDYLFYPDGVSLVFHSMPKLAGALGVPLQAVFPLTASYNIVFLASFVGTGLTSYWLCRWLLGRSLPAFIAGALFAFAPFRWGQVSHLNLLSTVLLPLFVLLLLKGKDSLERGEGPEGTEGRALRAGTWGYFLAAGAVLGLSSYDTEIYTIFMLLFTAVLLGFYFPFRIDRDDLRRWGSLLAGVGVVLLVALVVYSPLLVAAAREVGSQGNYAGQAQASAAHFSAELRYFLLPESGSALFGDTFEGLQSAAVQPEISFLGWTALALASYGLYRNRRRRDIWLWVAAALFFALLALGPRPLAPYAFLGQAARDLPGPFELFARLPLLNGLRVPSRFVVMTSLCVTVLAGYGAASLFSRLREQRWQRLLVPAAAALLLLLASAELKPVYTATSTSVPPVYEDIAPAGGLGSLLIVPVGWATGDVRFGNPQVWTEIPQTVHGLPMLGGMVARAPEERLAAESREPVLDYLGDPVGRRPSAADTSPQQIDRFLERYRPDYIVVYGRMPDLYIHGDFIESPEILDRQTRDELDAYISGDLGFVRFAQTEELTAYRRP